MRMWVTKFSVVFAISILLIGGCREFDDILVNINDSQVTFTLPQQQLNTDKQYILYDIAVAKEECKKDCVYWEMVRTDEPTQPYDSHFIKFPLYYGRPIDNMLIRLHKPLSKGRYSVVATIAVVENNKFIPAKSVHKLFEIDSLR